MKTQVVRSWIAFVEFFRLHSATLFLIPAVLSASISRAAYGSDPERSELHFTFQSKKSGAQTELHLKPLADQHFNLAAPNALQRVQPAKVIEPQVKTTLEFVYILKASDSGGRYELTVYTCDNQNTSCVQQVAGVVVKKNGQIAIEAKSEQAEAVSPPESALNVKQTPDGVTTNNDLEEGLRQAKKRRQKVLLVFSAIWCPSCLKLENDVLSSDEFKKLSQRLTLVKIDFDWLGSAKLKNRYHIEDVPTVVLADENGNELSRIHGYHTRASFLAELEKSLAVDQDSVVTLQKKASAGDQVARDRLGLLAYDSLDYDSAISYLKDSKTYRDRFLISQVNKLKMDETGQSNADLISKLEQLIAANPSPPDLPSWQLDLATAQKAAKVRPSAVAESAKKAISLAEGFIKNPPEAQTQKRPEADEPLSIDSLRDDVTLDQSHFWAVKAKAQTLLGETENAKQSWKTAVRVAQSKPSDPLDRGRQLELISLLKEVKAYAQIDAILEKLQTAFPSEYTFYYRRAWYDLEQAKLSQAEAFAREALRHSYEGNRIDSAVLLTKILLLEKKQTEAENIAKTTLAEVSQPSVLTPFTNRQFQILKAIASGQKT